MDDIANFDSSTTEASSVSTDHKTVATTASPYNITRPRIELRTGSEERRLTLPGGNLSKRPEPLRFVSTPPDSPTRTRAYTMGSSARDNAAVTPPPTPTTPSRPKYDSASTFLSPSPSARTGDATSSRHATLTRPTRDTAASLEDREKPEAGSTELLRFTYWLSDYEIETKENGKKKLIGSGVWSDVFLAKPCLPKPGALEQAAAVAAVGPKSTMTPPITPVRTRNSSLSSLSKEKLSQVLPQVPPQYAVKVPASRSAKTVLGEEARIISYLSRFPDAEKHIVPFYGQDARTDALVLKAMDCTLETWIQSELNTHNEAARARELARVFPSIAIKLIRGLMWMQEKGCIHADIKPSNVLISAPTDPLNPSVPRTVYSDFSSTILTLPTATQDLTADANAASESKPPAPLGGGTWDFLDPLLLGKPSAPVSPTPTTDLWSLAITLLFIVIGASPYDSFRGNKYQQREMIKQGAPLSCLAHGDEGARNLARLEGLSRALGWDVRGWFAQVLRRDGAARVGVKEWREEIEGVAGKNRMKI